MKNLFAWSPICEVLKNSDVAHVYNQIIFTCWTDYWVSQGRKFCEFCKCSIADNKPSIQFHENGKKHKENVAKRLSEMQKKAAKEAKNALDFEKEIKRMEAAAHKAYMDDVQSSADFTSKLIRAGIEKLPTPEPVEPEPKPKPARKPEKRGGGGGGGVKKWMEAVSEDGKTYYWNVETGESTWDKPSTGYVSVAEQGKQKSHKKPPKGSQKFKKHKKPGKGQFSKNKSKPTEKKTEEKQEEFIIIPQGHPYGKWKKVEPAKEEKMVDLQLPKQEFIEIVVPKLKEEPQREFKEKTSTPGFVSSTQGETGFKKRKIASDARKNMRQRLNDD